MTIQVLSGDPKADAAVNKPADAKKVEEKAEQAASAPVEETQAEQKEAANSEVAATEEEESEAEAEGKDSESKKDAETEPEVEASSTEPPKKKGGFQRRIDKLTEQKMLAQQEAEYWKQQAIKSAGAPKAEPPKVELPSPAASDGKPKPDAFETHAEYVEALTDWKTDQKFKERDQKAENTRLETERAKQTTTYQEKAKAFLEKHPDFDEVVEDLVVSPVVVGIIQTSENGPAIAYELGKNPDEAKRIAKLPPLQAALELGAIRSRIASKASGEKKTEPKRVSSAPAPLAPVGGGGKASGPKPTLEELAKTDVRAFKERRNQEERELKQRRRAQ